MRNSNQTIRLEIPETDEEMILRSVNKLKNENGGNPAELHWTDLRRVFTSHDLARMVSYFVQKEKFDEERKLNEILLTDYELV